MNCPLCKIKLKKQEPVSNIYRKEPFDNGLCLTPPMGWNTWNYFKDNINEKMLLETAKALKETGLLDAGYRYLNLDDYWEAYERDEEGRLECDRVRFPQGMKHYVDEVNKLGFKAGIYSCNGTRTCQGLPASLGHEYMDALQFVKWGIEYLKYDFCYHKISSSYGPEIFSLTVTKVGTGDETVILAKNATLYGTAKLKLLENNYHESVANAKEKQEYITGLDANKGSATFHCQVKEAGKYFISINTRYPFKKTTLEKEIMAAATVNGKETFFMEPGAIEKPCKIAPFRFVADLKAGNNDILFFNPIGNQSDSIMINYMTMSDALQKAVKTVTEQTGVQQKPIAYSLCCWGNGEPWEWGSTVSNLWRTTGDICWTWKSIMDLYEKNVVLYEYASPGHWNDPDMLEVGNGDLTLDENKAHFALWCMMASPLLLGNDVTNMKKEHLDIILNKDIIAIDQDRLGRQAKRMTDGKKKGVDVLVRPLADGGIALCALNKGEEPTDFTFDLSALASEKYVEGFVKERYDSKELYTGEKAKGINELKVTLPVHGVGLWKLQ